MTDPAAPTDTTGVQTSQPAAADEMQPPQADTTDEGTDTGDTGKPANREAKYRTERNEARAQVEALQARVDTMERRTLDRLAADTLADPTDWQPDLDTLRDDDGNLDEGKATAALAELVKAKPHYARPKPPSRSGGEFTGGNNGAPGPQRMGSIFGT